MPNTRYYHLVFKDNGIGFEQELHNQIFTIFQRLNEMKNMPAQVLVWPSAKIVENHQGIINAVSSPETVLFLMCLFYVKV